MVIAQGGSVGLRPMGRQPVPPPRICRIIRNDHRFPIRIMALGVAFASATRRRSSRRCATHPHPQRCRNTKLDDSVRKLRRGGNFGVVIPCAANDLPHQYSCQLAPQRHCRMTGSLSEPAPGPSNVVDSHAERWLNDLLRPVVDLR